MLKRFGHWLICGSRFNKFLVVAKVQMRPRRRVELRCKLCGLRTVESVERVEPPHA